MNEDERQFLHIFLAVCSILLLEFFGVQLAAYLIGAVLVAGLAVVHAKLSGFSLGQLDLFVERFERPGVTPGYGAMTFAAGVLAMVTMLASKEQMMASIIILGFGDAASTLFGRRSRARLPYSRNKTYAGTAAFFLFSLPAAYFAGWLAVAAAAAAAFVESLESHIDDNLAIAVVCVALFRLLG